MYTTKYNPTGVRQFNLSTKKNGVRTANYTYKVPRPYTPRAIPNIASGLSSRYAPGKEQKYFYIHEPINPSWNAGGNVDIKTAGYWIPLLQRQTANAAWTRIPQGAGPSDRIGNRITVKQIKMKGVLEIGGHSNERHGNRGRYRVMIIQDVQANGIILDHTATPNLLHGADIDSPINPIYNSKFKILADKIFQPNLYPTGLSNVANAEFLYAPKALSFDFSVRPNSVTTWQGATGTLTDVVANSYYLFIISEYNGTATPGEGRCTPGFYFKGMLFYDDN